VNKAEFIEVLATHFDGNKAEAARALNAVTQTITYQTASGEKVTITGFGVFEKVPRSARMVRNPRTGERKRAKATAIPRFRAGTDLKAYVSGAKKVPRATKKAAAGKTAAASATKASATKASATKTAPAKKTTAAKTTAKKAPAAKTTPAKTTAAAKKTTAAKKTPAAKKAPAKKATAKR
jgi:DNA-binding protein HU-beta